jgi:hypothetical protein
MNDPRESQLAALVVVSDRRGVVGELDKTLNQPGAGRRV